MKPTAQHNVIQYPRPLACAALLLVLTAGLVGCGDKEKKAGQSLARVNGEDITVLQLNEELQRSNVPAGQQEAASKQLLEALIDRQLLQGEAIKEKIDRDPKVVQAVERAKVLIIAQSYMQRRMGTPTRPSAAEVAEYYQKNPQFFANRKQFDLRQLVIDSKDLDDAVKQAMDAAKSLDEVAAWLDAHKIKYARSQLSRSGTDLPAELSAKLLEMPKGQMFIVREGPRSMLISIADIKDAPLALEVAAPQIEQLLSNKKNKDIADAELKRLRAAAKIEYLNKAEAPKAAPASTPAAAGATAAERGVAGLK